MKVSERVLYSVVAIYAAVLALQFAFPYWNTPSRPAAVRTPPPTVTGASVDVRRVRVTAKPLPATSDAVTVTRNPSPDGAGFASWRRPDPKLPATWNVTNPTGTYLPHAYVLVLSNEIFVDGALVMGASLREHSSGLRSNTVQLTIVVTSGRLCAASINRLIETGFDVIVEVPSLAVRVPKAAFKDTFDKSYIFGLTVHSKIVFMDADMLAVRDPDALFSKDYGPDSTWVGAIGFRDREGDYFQTGMMVIRPSDKVFADIMKEFDANAPPRGKRYNHGMEGRDGVLLRTVFGSRFKAIDNKYSRNLNPRYRIPKSVVCLHLRGKHKPWFDWRLPNADPELGKKEFGFPYVAWWETYERIHRQSKVYREALEGHADPSFGGRFAAAHVSPLTHVWMLRYTNSEYVQLLRDAEDKDNDRTANGLAMIVGEVGKSCEQVCASTSKVCLAEAFNFTMAKNCAAMQTTFGCKECELAVYWKPHPHTDFPGLDTSKGICKWNLMRDARSRSTCGAYNETTRRWCPCVPAGRA